MSVTLQDFERAAIENANFHHRDHVRVAYELIAREPFEMALSRFMIALRGIAAAAGDPSKVHLTISVAFLSAIAERQAREPAATWEEFAARNADLIDKSFLRRWYSADELESEIARKTFVLPQINGLLARRG
jgi:hypothetical protein